MTHRNQIALKNLFPNTLDTQFFAFACNAKTFTIAIMFLLSPPFYGTDWQRFSTYALNNFNQNA